MGVQREILVLEVAGDLEQTTVGAPREHSGVAALGVGGGLVEGEEAGYFDRRSPLSCRGETEGAIEAEGGFVEVPFDVECAVAGLTGDFGGAGKSYAGVPLADPIGDEGQLCLPLKIVVILEGEDGDGGEGEEGPESLHGFSLRLVSRVGG